MSTRAPNRPFTRFLDLLVEGVEPSQQQIDELWSALRRAVVAELERRGLWAAPPWFVGIAGRESWLDDEGAALEELLSDIYCFVFVDRLSALARQRRVKPNVDGLVFLNIRHFFHERMKLHDPVGYRVYEVVHAAAELAIERGELSRVDDGIRDNGSTGVSGKRPVKLSGSCLELGVEPMAEAPGLVEEGSALPDQVLESWLTELMPELVTAPGRARRSVVERLSERLGELSEAGVSAVPFTVLVTELKKRVRRRWRSAFRDDLGEVIRAPESEDDGPEWLWVVRPSPRYVEQQYYRRLVACIGRGVDAMAAAPPPKPGLKRLWACLLAYAGDGEGAPDGKSEQRPPSQRSLAAFLGLSRDRLAAHLRILRTQVEGCQSELAGVAEHGGES